MKVAIILYSYDYRPAIIGAYSVNKTTLKESIIGPALIRRPLQELITRPGVNKPAPPGVNNAAWS